MDKTELASLVARASFICEQLALNIEPKLKDDKRFSVCGLIRGHKPPAKKANDVMRCLWDWDGVTEEKLRRTRSRRSRSAPTRRSPTENPA